MRRSAKRSRNAAGKSLGDMCATQKALATVGSSVRGGASASMVSSSVAVLPILFFSGLVARNFWKTAPPLAAVPSELLAFEFEAGSPPPPPELATKEGKNRGGPLNPARLSATRWAKLAWLAEVKGWNYTNASEFNGTLDRDLESARYALLVKIKGIDYALNRQRHSAHIYGRGTHAIALTPASLRMRSRAEGKLEEKFDAEYKKASNVAQRRIARQSENPGARRRYTEAENDQIERGEPVAGRGPNALRQKRADLAIPKPPFPTAIFDASLPPLELRYDSWTPLCPEHSIPPEAEVDWANACARIPENWPLSFGTSDVDLRDRHGEAVQVRCCSIDALHADLFIATILRLLTLIYTRLQCCSASALRLHCITCTKAAPCALLLYQPRQDSLLPEIHRTNNISVVPLLF